MKKEYETPEAIVTVFEEKDFLDSSTNHLGEGGNDGSAYERPW